MSAARFRTLALVVALAAAAGALLCAEALARYGGLTREFGWTAVRHAGGYAVQVAPDGPAAGVLVDGDRLVAVNGDRRAEHVPPQLLRMWVRGPSYTLTIQRGAAETTLPLTLRTMTNPELLKFSWSVFFVGVVWCLVLTVVALLRPDQPMARVAYVCGMSIGLFLLSQASAATITWLPHRQATALLGLFPISQLHLAMGYDFYLRFPTNVATGRSWRAVRAFLYALCGATAAWTVSSFVMFVRGEQPYLDFRIATETLGQANVNATTIAQLVTVVAILAVLARNYRTAQTADERRRLRWLVGGTVLGLSLFLIAAVLRLMAIWILAIRPWLGQWNLVANVATIAIPLSLSYAIVKHHVFDITVVVRRGLQYLLAKNALRALVSLPAAALAADLVMHRDQPIGQLLLTDSFAVYLIVAAVSGLAFHARVTRWIDRRFFREVYDRERMLLNLMSDVERLDSGSTVSKLVSQELQSAFHPACLFVWYREAASPALTLSYSSGGYIHTAQIGADAPLAMLAAQASGVIAVPVVNGDPLPRADRDWLEEAGVRLIVPMIGADQYLAGMLMLGAKKSEEPYSPDDLKLLQAIARQIAVGRENLRLKERVDHDRRIRHDVLAHLETGHVSLLKECPSCGACYDAEAASCAADGAELQLSLPVERTIDGKYRLDRLLGKGGMGAVYEAGDLRLARAVAIKIMLGRAFGDRHALRRFEREAQASARLTHPNIVTVFDFGAAGAAGAYIVMELVRGRTLRAELEQHGHLPPAIAARWFEQICAAVAAAHRQRIVHRDLKPENVLVTRDAAAAVKVLDFGLAKMTSIDAEDSAGLTQPGVVIGTAGYMAPEQLTAGPMDERTDIFALGVMVAEAVTGRRPFRGRTHSELLAAIMNEPLTLGGDGVALRRVESVLQRAAAKDPSARFASVDEFAAAILPALHELAAAASTGEGAGITVG
jgi:GAF domain-containing protein